MQCTSLSLPRILATANDGEQLVNRSTNAEVAQTLIADDELPVREVQTTPDLSHHALVVHGGALIRAFP